MFSIEAGGDARASVYVDLIGDLDAVLARTFAETLLQLTQTGTTEVLVSTKRIGAATTAAIIAVDSALVDARASGCSVALDPGSRKMRAAFAMARVRAAGADEAAVPRRSRHLMIAHHTPVAELTKSA